MYAEGSASASAGAKSYPIIFGAATFDGAISTAVNQTFEWQAEPVGNDTASPAASMNLLYAAGSATPANTGFSIGSNGEINFAAGQTFPGTGTITSVTPGTGLTGGGSSGSVTLDVNEGVVAFQSDFTAGINTAETYAKNNFLPLTGAVWPELYPAPRRASPTTVHPVLTKSVELTCSTRRSIPRIHLSG